MPNPSEKVSEGEGVARHTPGPWHIRRVGLCASVYGPDGRAIVSTGPSRRHVHECRANAILIAAAPCLAEALQGAADMCAVYADFIRNHVTAEEIEVHPYLPALEDVIETARAALSRLNP